MKQACPPDRSPQSVSSGCCVEPPRSQRENVLAFPSSVFVLNEAAKVGLFFLGGQILRSMESNKLQQLCKCNLLKAVGCGPILLLCCAKHNGSAERQREPYRAKPVPMRFPFLLFGTWHPPPRWPGIGRRRDDGARLSRYFRSWTVTAKRATSGPGGRLWTTCCYRYRAGWGVFS